MGHDDYDDDESMLMIGFADVDALLTFIHWVYENFDTDEDFRNWFNKNVHHMDDPSFNHPASSEYDDKFWSIVNRSLKNVTGEPHDPLPDSN